MGEMQIPVTKVMPRQKDMSQKLGYSNSVGGKIFKKFLYLYNHLSVEYVHCVFTWQIFNFFQPPLEAHGTGFARNAWVQCWTVTDEGRPFVNVVQLS